ncbi:MAG: hypothetical protein L0322_08840 [Chloroflexi bacterium]|nr:hypothetical protein [Chloroflexota bacterium]
MSVPQARHGRVVAHAYEQQTAVSRRFREAAVLFVRMALFSFLFNNPSAVH